MSKKDFIALADAIRASHETNKAHFSQYHLAVLADFLAAQNPRFMRQRWLAYINGECGPNGGRR